MAPFQVAAASNGDTWPQQFSQFPVEELRPEGQAHGLLVNAEQM